MTQTEAQRQFYLGSAGIRLWYAREPLPGAAPSPEFIFPEPDEPACQPLVGPGPALTEKAQARPQTDRPHVDKKGVQRLASLQALMENKPEAVGQSPDPSPAPVTELPSAALEGSDETSQKVELSPTEAFSLGVFVGAKHILVADISREASLQLQETLAGNILKSLGEVQPKPVDLVHWPVFNNRVVPGNSLSDLGAVMKHVLRDLDGQKVIVLGGGGEIAGGSGYAGWLPEVLGRAPDIKTDHSLAALASNPALKRLLWEQLKPLVQK